MASRRPPYHDQGKTHLVQKAYRVIAFGRGGKILSDHYLYSEDLAQMQLDILLIEQQYRACRIVLYNPEGEVEFEKDPND
jgi:hypothetical protein